ncbi:MAG: hypothetical protein BJ554DRAFT_1123 [Olpidium bornovanus]|uniref:Dihydroorotase n=1 Tax=Olpidium bornovanus TaxID=278681 RepID=A0A8H8DHD0_9FUNG|nr:MAG: hypothetical protein BJ554DRAFT_1123 [Olpidium bornovanus]
MADAVLELPAAADMHVHLRQGSLMRMVVPKLCDGGVGIAYVMVRAPPGRPFAHRDAPAMFAWKREAVAYRAELEKLVPPGSVTFMMTLYLCPDLTPDEIWKAKEAGIAG